MNSFELCKRIRDLDPKVMGAGIIEKAKLVALAAKPGVPIPTDDKFDQLFFQTTLISSVMKTNTDFFGQPRFFTLHFENSDMYFFHLTKYGSKGVLAIQLAQPYVHEEIVSKVDRALAESL